MASFAKVTLIGNVGSDPEVRNVGDSKVASFPIAVNERTGSGNNRKDETTWYRCNAWGRQAEIAEQYIKKGNPLFVEGKLSVRKYQTQDGREGTSVEVRITDFQLLGGRGDVNEGDSGYPNQGGNLSAPSQEFSKSSSSQEDDLPF